MSTRNPRAVWSSLLLATCLSLAPSFVHAQLAVGADAPDFSLFDTTGVRHRLSTENPDHVVVLFFVGYG